MSGQREGALLEPGQLRSLLRAGDVRPAWTLAWSYGRSRPPGGAWPFTAAQEPRGDGIHRNGWGGARIQAGKCRVVAERLCVVPNRLSGRQAAAVARSWDRGGKRHAENAASIRAPPRPDRCSCGASAPLLMVHQNYSCTGTTSSLEVASLVVREAGVQPRADSPVGSSHLGHSKTVFNPL